MNTRNFLLYLKALIWSVFVSYTGSTVAAIVQCLRDGTIPEYPEFLDSHLGDSLRFILESLPRQEDRELIACGLEKVKQSQPSIIYRNMVIEVGHYVTTREAMGDVPADCPGVIYCLEASTISVLFRKPDGTLVDRKVHPFQVMPVYTLTIPESST